ncbi:5'-nucleotidase SurE [uncultured delta proteobacterium]|uniref:5'-nucleotidase SurE n=1 Tax=uncultured delta proteobacterium TaxID=34034 RepID=A0A212JEY4_9DELT|nr:5'-nucleotidase SurE [uncultured delta proteobacterium]
MIVALTNDDGIRAHGLRSMYKALLDAGHTVRVVAPTSEQSAVGHAITVRDPLRVKQCTENGFTGISVSGTPADCVKLGISALLDEEPDIVVSGINAGANVGPDIMYSGTVAAAREAAAMGYPAMALSFDSFKEADLTEYARYAVSLMEKIVWHEIPERRVVNVNFPNLPFSKAKGLKVCPQTSAVWHDWYHEYMDPRGTPCWWLDGDIPSDQVAPGTDRALLTEGWITLTPLRFDFTDQETLAALRDKLGAD